MNKKNTADSKLLPQDAGQAIQRLVKISQSLIDLADREAQSLVMNDLMTFSILQDEKDMLASHYTKASNEFRERIEDFRKVDRGLLLRLEKLQKNLGEKTQNNSLMVSQMRKRAEQHTQKTLLTVQEMAQIRPVKTANTNSQQKRT
jgi:hypothetical protein